MSYNLSAQLADNLKFYEEFAGSRAAASFPEKSQVPLVWDLYMDARGPAAGLAPVGPAGGGRLAGGAAPGGGGRGGPLGPAQRPAEDPGPPVPPPDHQ